jgi:AraC family transcriptional regulator
MKKRELDNREDAFSVWPSCPFRDIPASLGDDREICAMPQQQLLSDNKRHLAMHAAVREVNARQRDADCDATSTVRLDDVIGSPSSPGGASLLQAGVTLDVRYLRCVLAAAAEGLGQRAIVVDGVASATCAPRLNDNDRVTFVAGNDEAIRLAVAYPQDTVIKYLSDALAMVAHAPASHMGIQEDALRLAIILRLLGLQVGAEQTTVHDNPGHGPAHHASGVRSIRALQKWRLKRVFDYIDNHLSARVSLSDLAAVAGLSRMHFASQFRAATGLRPHEYLLRQRIQRADELLRTSTMAIVEIALAVGFQTQAHFTTVFKRIVGSTPRQWRNSYEAVDQAAE